MRNEIIVATYPEAMAAHLARVRLEAAGIEVWTGNENFSAVYPLHTGLIGGVQLKVREEDADYAAEVLRGLGEEEGAGDGPDREGLACPECGSENTGENSNFFSVLLLTVVTFGLYLPLFYKKHACRDCGHTW